MKQGHVYIKHKDKIHITQKPVRQGFVRSDDISYDWMIPSHNGRRLFLVFIDLYLEEVLLIFSK